MKTVIRAAALAVAAVYLRRSCLAVRVAFGAGVSVGKLTGRRQRASQSHQRATQSQRGPLAAAVATRRPGPAG